jgi:hypothetical protein
VGNGALLADSVTRLGPAHAGRVVVTGSHGGAIAAAYVARAGVRAAIFNDAGRGPENAGIAGLAALERIGIAAAAVGHDTARIGDARDTLENGMVTALNGPARACGVQAGMRCREAASRLHEAPWARGEVVLPEQSRAELVPAAPPRPAIIGLDSIGLVEPGDAGCILVIGSHGALHGGDPDSALPAAAAGAFFHDAGRGRDDAGITRLPALAARGIAAAAVDFRSARIGDARSLWTTGVVSFANAPALAAGVVAGARVADAARGLRERAAPT